VLASTNAGPVLLEGVWGSRPYVAWGFDPRHTDLPLRVSFPVLVQNAVEYLAPAEASLPGGVSTGSAPTIPWPVVEDVTLVSPGGGERVLRPVSGRLRLPPIDASGVWTLTGARREVAFAASLLDDAESDLGSRPGETTRGGVPIERGGATLAARDLWRPLVLAGLALLLLEGAAFHRRWLS
jgi:hypothetical protein